MAYIGLFTTQIFPSELSLNQTLNLFTHSPIIQHQILSSIALKNLQRNDAWIWLLKTRGHNDHRYDCPWLVGCDHWL